MTRVHANLDLDESQSLYLVAESSSEEDSCWRDPLDIPDEMFEKQPFDKDAFEEADEDKDADHPHNRAKELGMRGERAAARFLEHIGYEIIERNWTCPAGEADIIARDGKTVVFCEVKTRTNLEKGLPAEAVDAEKRNRYERIAGWFLRDYEEVDVPIRFDVLGLLVIRNDRALIRHYINAFGGAF